MQPAAWKAAAPSHCLLSLEREHYRARAAPVGDRAKPPGSSTTEHLPRVLACRDALELVLRGPGRVPAHQNIPAAGVGPASLLRRLLQRLQAQAKIAASL
jgi:hypothetical protein